MQFSTFIQSISGNTILLKNTVPIENVQTITSYSDNSNGSFLKKEIRWSFNNVYWSSWQTLTLYSITHINTHLNPYLYLEIRYVLNAVGSGTVSTFNIIYIISNTALTPPIDIIQQYNITEITDASTLNGYAGSWYLNRLNHKGQQSINTITGLQTILNGLQVSYYLKESSIGTGFVWNAGMLDVSVNGGSGDVTKAYVDGSLATLNASVNLAFLTNASLGNLTKSVNILDTSIKNYATNASVGTALGAYATNSSVNSAFLTNASLGKVLDVSLGSLSDNDYLRYDVTLNKWVNETTEDVSLYFYNKTEIDASFARILYVDASLTTKVSKSGDTMSGDLTINASLFVNGVMQGNMIDISETATDIGVPDANKIRIYAAEADGFTVLETITNLGIVNRINQDSFRVARNTSGVEIAAGKTVYYTGSTGQKPNFSLALSSSEGSMPAIGVTTAIVGNGQYGEIMIVGRLTSVKTDYAGWTEGDVLYVSDSSAGELTNIRPTHPNLAQWIGTIEYVHSSQGSILIKTQALTGIEDGTNRNSYTIGDTLAGTKALVFDGTTDASLQWDNSTWIFNGGDLNITNRKITNVATPVNASDAVNKFYVDASFATLRAIFGTKNSSANGIPSQTAYDASYFYICTSTNIWGRLLLQNNY